MFKAVDVKAVKRYVSPKDPSAENPTVFIIGYIDPALRSFIDGKFLGIEIDEKNKSINKPPVNPTQYSILMFMYGLRGVENFMGPDGVTPLALTLENQSIAGVSYPCVPKDVIANFHMELIVELAEEIVKFQSLSVSEIKN